ncbi:uncharacterized protein [Branchiostoma lanceolatum]|uniref:uncharacterized protein n=1 Tax=Branchiostoma lanceolatum TaxID=7740 RepID=UPI003452F14C
MLGPTTTPGTTTTLPVTTPAPSTETTITAVTVGPTGADSTRMLVAIVGCLAGVLVAGVLLFLMWRRSKLPEDSCHLQGDAVPHRTFNNGLQQEGSTVPLLMDTEQRDSFSAAPETMNNFSVHPVLLIYSHDHPLHEATVRAFAAFLRQQCGCDVTLDDYCMQSIQRRGKIPWLCRQIEKAERVIVVCSKGTKRIWEDIVKAELSVLSPYAPPCGDMVRPAIHLITAEFHGHSTFEKYITAYFSYSSEEDVPRALNVGNNYILMKHFEELYIHLLRWNRRPARPDFALPELGEDQYHQSEAGGKLKRCIDEMTAFQAAHPTWFQDSQGSGQACGGGEDTGLQPHYSSTPGDVPDSRGQQYTSNHFTRPHHASQSQSRRDNNYDYEMSPESSDSPCIVSTPDKTELDVHCNGPSRAQPMTGQSRDAVRPDISGPGGRRPDATYTYSLPVMNTVDTLLIPNGHANRRTAPTRAVGGPQSIESEGTSDYSVPNRTVPNLVISPSVALLARHVEQFQATQGGASEDEGIDTLASRDRMTDV